MLPALQALLQQLDRKAQQRICRIQPRAIRLLVVDGAVAIALMKLLTSVRAKIVG